MIMATPRFFPRIQGLYPPNITLSYVTTMFLFHYLNAYLSFEFG